MGFSVSGATAVLLVGMLISAATLYPALERSSELKRDSLDAQTERTLDRQNTDIRLRNATYNGTAETVEVEVENSGTTTLSVEDTDLLTDGTYRTGATVAVEGSTTRTVWAPGETLTFTLSGVTSGPSRVKVVTEHGIGRSDAVVEVA
jgi:flagellar protein FlaF